MNPALTYLTWAALLTALMWVPYILDRFKVWGIVSTVSYPENPPPPSPWAGRAKKAHANAVENLAVFAVLVLAANALNAVNGTVEMAALIYLWARVVHFAVYVLAIPWVRTLAFLIGFGCQVAVAVQILF